MRVYHYLSSKFGLESIQLRRLKLSTFASVNDPFEFACVDSRDEELRTALTKTKAELAKTKGFICFGRCWRNTVMWAHYADRHRGMCLGFDVPDELLIEARYVREKFRINKERFLSDSAYKEKIAFELLRTKHIHWAYEDEVRLHATLDSADIDTGLYFKDMDDDLQLREVMVGAASTVTRAALSRAIDEGGGYSLKPPFKVRPGFGMFSMCPQKDRRLWL